MKKIIQLLIFFLLTLLSILFYLNFLKIEKTTTSQKVDITNNPTSLETDNNLIKNLKYDINFDDNTKYKITAELSEIKYIDGIEIVEMQSVTATFIDKDSVPLTITSQNATYNNSNYSTKFANNVKVTYLSNIILSEKLDVDFSENIIKIYENVVYEGLQGMIKADNVVLNLITKNMKIFMLNNKEKVEISSK